MKLLAKFGDGFWSSIPGLLTQSLWCMHRSVAELACDLFRKFAWLVPRMPWNFHSSYDEWSVLEKISVDAARPATLGGDPGARIVVSAGGLNHDRELRLTFTRKRDDLADFQSGQHAGDLGVPVVERVSACFLLLYAESMSDVQVLQQVLNRVV